MFDQIPGVMTTLKISGRSVEVPENGWVGELRCRRKVVLEINVRPDTPIFGINIWERKGKKIVSLRKNLAEVISPGWEGKFYERWIPVKFDNEETHTEYLTNHQDLIGLVKESPGLFFVWEIALVSQKGSFFLTTQKVFGGRCYRDGDKMVAHPYFSNDEHDWSQLLDFVGNLFKDQIQEFLPIEAHKPGPPLSGDDLKSRKGRVIWWNFAEGKGMIQIKQGLARVDWPEVKPRNNFSYLLPDELVSYALVKNPCDGNGESIGRAFKVEPIPS